MATIPTKTRRERPIKVKINLQRRTKEKPKDTKTFRSRVERLEKTRKKTFQKDTIKGLRNRRTTTTRHMNSDQIHVEKPESCSPREISVSITIPCPPKYTFVPKGDVYTTRHCRSRTLADGFPVYVVHSENQPGKKLGLRVPGHIAKNVAIDAAKTKNTRIAAVKAKDIQELERAKTALVRLFPGMPKSLTKDILKHAFAKHSGRVGRTGKLDLDRKIHLAVHAHARHKHTKYDHLLKTMDRERARKQVKNEIDGIVGSWAERRTSRKTRKLRT